MTTERETADVSPVHATTIIGPDSRPDSRGPDSRPDSRAPESKGPGSAVQPPLEDTRAALPLRVGPYRVTGELGRGGMGVVYRALDAEERPVAVKMVIDPRHASADNLRRFEREARAAIKLRHPNIVAVHATGVHEGKPYLVMELIEGESLELMLRRGPVPTRQVIEIVRAIALALDHAHANGVVHRDLKPENILIDREGKPHLADFGLARDQTETENLTVSGTVLGTPAYMAPEQAGGEVHEQGPHSDIYGLGAVLYRALSGQPPFKASTVSALMKKVLFENAPPPSRFNPAVAPELDEIVLRCLSKRAAFRYPSGAALAEELRRFVAGEQIQQRPVQSWLARHPREALALVVVLAALACGVSWFVTVHRPAARRAGALDALLAAEAATKKGDPIAALDALDAAVKLDPDSPRVWHERGRVKLAIFDLEGALADLTRALELDSRDPQTWVDRAVTHLERHELDPAISDASRAIALAPKDARAWFERGRARHLKDDRDRAADDLRKCMSLFPEGSPDPVYQNADGHLRAILFGR